MDNFKANITIDLNGISLGLYRKALKDRLDKLKYIDTEDSIDIGSVLECATTIEQLRISDKVLKVHEEYENKMDNLIKKSSKEVDDSFINKIEDNN